MTNIERYLRDVLEDALRVVVLGVGSCLMGDDAVGVYITDTFIERYGESVADRVFFVSGGNAPENFSGVIRNIAPDRLLIIDAAEVGGEPGDCCDIDPSVVSGVSFSTHMLPLKVMLSYLQKQTGCQIAILGIMPESLEFGSEMTPKVREAADEVIRVLQQILQT